jgi:SNF2 family DNA or RNA helicase
MAMGLGKTAVSSRLIDAVSNTLGVERVLVTAPTRVQTHWRTEADAWSAGLPLTLLSGSPSKRAEQLRKPGIHVLSHGLLNWLTRTKHTPYDLFIVDESSKFRNWTAQRTKAARRIASTAKYRLLLTGSPAPNCPSEFFAQQFLLDRGATLGSTLGKFRERFMYRGGFENREWLFNYDLLPKLEDLLRPWYLRQGTELLSNMPEVIYNPIKLDLPPGVLAAYKEFEAELYTELLADPLITFSGSGKYATCRQLASGGYYDADKNSIEVHEIKLDALEGICDETPGPVLVAYQFRRELDHLRSRFGSIPAINGDTNNATTQQIIDSWKQHKIPLLAAQSQAISHGVDGLQHGGNTVVWYTLTDSLETHDQLNARLARSGQTNTVIVHYLLCRATVDVAMLNLIRKKYTIQHALLEHLRT